MESTQFLKFWKSQKREPATPEEYYNVFVQSPSGRHVLGDMMKASHMMEPVFEADPYHTAFRDGERNAILRILTILNDYERGLR